MARARRIFSAYQHHALVALLVTLALALAGCTNRAGGDDGAEATRGPEPAWLTFEGNGQGEQLDTVLCPSGNGELRVSGNAAGNTTVMVTGGDGVLFWGQTQSGDLSIGPESLDGRPGEWTLEVMRTAAFDGHYTATLSC